MIASEKEREIGSCWETKKVSKKNQNEWDEKKFFLIFLYFSLITTRGFGAEFGMNHEHTIKSWKGRQPKTKEEEILMCAMLKYFHI